MPPSAAFKRLYRHGALVIWPPDELRATVNQLRQRFDPASQEICDAHITLSQPLIGEPAAEDLAAIEKIVARHLPMEIAYGPLGDFLPYPCVYLKIRPQEPLKALQRDLYELNLFDLSLPFSDPDLFIFHMSITDGYPDEGQSRMILAALHGYEPCGRFQLDRVAWIRPDAEFHFETHRLFDGQAP